MTEQPLTLDIIRELLSEQRDAQLKGNSMLSDLRVDVAALARSHDSQGQAIGEMRIDLRNISDRLRDAEMQMQRFLRPEDLVPIRNEHDKLEHRVRKLEGDGRETKVVRGALTGGLRDIWRHTAGGVIGAIATALAIAWSVRHGSPPG